MDKRRLPSALVATGLFLSACGLAPADVPTQTPVPIASMTVVPGSSPTPASHLTYVELARQVGYVQFHSDQETEGPLFSLWLPAAYVATPGYWQSDEFLAAASERVNDYAYDIYGGNTLFTAGDRTFYSGSPYANECSHLINEVDVSGVGFAIRVGRDPQLAGMTIANYGGLLANAIQKMREGEWNYPQQSGPFEAPGFEAWRIISDFSPPEYEGGSYDVTFVDYIFGHGDTIWVLTFSVDTELFWERSACAYLADQFDLVARTFEIEPEVQ